MFETRTNSKTDNKLLKLYTVMNMKIDQYKQSQGQGTES